MPPGKEVAAIPRTRKAVAKPAADKTPDLLKIVETSLDGDKAEDIVAIDLRGKSTIADYMVIATGRNSRQLAAMASHLAEQFDATFHNVEDLRQFTKLPVLGAVSTIRTGAPKRALRLALTTASAVALIYVIVVLSTYAARGNEQIVWMLARGA